MKKQITTHIITIIIAVVVAATCSYAQKDTSLSNLGQATSSWKSIDFGTNKTVYGWFTNDATAGADSVWVAIGITGRIDTAQGLRTTIKAGEVLEIKNRVIRYIYYKRAGSNDVNVRGSFTR